MSSDLETGTGIIAQALSKPSKKKSKSKPKPKPITPVVVAADHGDGKNEGDDPNWAYEPPKGAELLDHGVDAGVFEWDSIKEDEDVEIWLVRVPDSIKAKHLEALEIDLPSSSSHTARIGSLTRKNTTYDVWSLGEDDADADDDDTDIAAAGGEELRGLSCLIPRKKKKGKLCIDPKPVSRHIVVSARPSMPTAPEQQPVIHQNPPRPSYGTELLTHYFEPYGARSKQIREHDLSVDVDESETSATKPTAMATSPEEKSAKLKESKGKKRKVEGDSPKKSKKHKSND